LAVLHRFCGIHFCALLRGNYGSRLRLQRGTDRAAKRVIDAVCASISTFEVLKMALEGHFFVQEAPQNTFYKPESSVSSLPSARSKALESMVLDT
jgi:hypothetical protein